MKLLYYDRECCRIMRHDRALDTVMRRLNVCHCDWTCGHAFNSTNARASIIFVW